MIQNIPFKTLLFCVFFFSFQLIALTNSTSAFAQLNNAALERPIQLKPENANEIRLGVYLLGFNKNNEYFNNIVDGYTYFGYHFMPRLTYNYGNILQLEAGALIWKDFGNSGFYSVEPVFTAKVQKDNWALVFGNLEGNLNHGYIEPLYDFERLMNDPLENGLQFLYDNDKIELDAWIDWNKMIYEFASEQEEIIGGAATAIQLYKREGKLGAGDTTQIKFPFQFTALHKGGQIDTTDIPLVTVANAAVGLELERKLPFKFLTRVYTKNYIVGYKDYSNEYRQAYTEGYGVYLNVGVDTKYQDVMLSYWYGEGYITELGGRLFQSASTTVTAPDFRQKVRRLLILRLMKDIHLMRDVSLTLRLEPVLDLDRPKLEFSNSFYLTFDTDFFLAKPRR